MEGIFGRDLELAAIERFLDMCIAARVGNGARSTATPTAGLSRVSSHS